MSPHRGPTRALRAFALAALCLVAAAEEGAPGETGPRIETDTTRFDLGKVYDRDPVSHRFIIRNIGTGDLELLSVKASCGCLYELPDLRRVPPGASSWLLIKYDLAEKHFGAYSEPVVLVTNDPKQPMIEFTIQVEYAPPVDVTPSALSFTREEVEARASKQLLLTIRTANDSARVEEVSVSPQGAMVVAELPEVASDSQTRRVFSVTPSPDFAAVTSLSSVTFETNLASVPFIEIPVTLNQSPGAAGIQDGPAEPLAVAEADRAPDGEAHRPGVPPVPAIAALAGLMLVGGLAWFRVRRRGPRS